MVGEQRTYAKGQKSATTWYDGITGPVAPRDATGKETLAAERQGNLIGFAPAMWGDSAHAAQPAKSAKLSYSYDGEHWTQARTSEHGGRWSAVVDHAGALGRPVSLKVELTDAKGAMVTQTVVRAYDVR
ncbi:hypothetical protein [Streptomyces sp. NPDC090036]|uniref:hypothetical protein n=1 Tax=Streptomyces sp. NPDC090036 TaxID=3365926 RepID=UPI00382A101C